MEQLFQIKLRLLQTQELQLLNRFYIHVSRGVPQGSNLSPRDFCGYIDSMWRLFEKIHDFNILDRIQIYMDDHVFFFKDIEELTKWIPIIEKW